MRSIERVPSKAAMSEAMAEAKAMSEAMSGEGASGSAYLGPQLTMPAPPPDVNPR